MKAGGLYIIGTERHRAGALTTSSAAEADGQGDAGSSKFYVALEDVDGGCSEGERHQGYAGPFSGGEDIPLEYGMMIKADRKGTEAH